MFLYFWGLERLTQIFWTPMKMKIFRTPHFTFADLEMPMLHCVESEETENLLLNNSLAGAEMPCNCMLDRARQRALTQNSFYGPGTSFCPHFSLISPLGSSFFCLSTFSAARWLKVGTPQILKAAFCIRKPSVGRCLSLWNPSTGGYLNLELWSSYHKGANLLEFWNWKIANVPSSSAESSVTSDVVNTMLCQV